MPRVDVTQDAVLNRLVEHLREALGLDKRQVYETLEPTAPPIIPKGGPYFVTVAPGAGQFVTGEQQIHNVTEEWSVVVTGYTRIKLDSTDHDEKVLRDAKRGLLEIKRLLLKALVGQDLTTKYSEEFLRNLLYARNVTNPQHDRTKGIGWISIEFGVDFDWDLT